VANYLFFPAADKAQDGIWHYTHEKWGQEQAEKYIMGLHEHIQGLADKILFWRTLPESLVVPADLDVQAYFSRYEHHYIFFRELSGDKIGIMSLLHERADVPVRLREDFVKIEDKD